MTATTSTADASGSQMLDLFRRFDRLPLGKRLYDRAVCLKAPYFASIRPRFVSLEPGRSEVLVPNRRSVRNHIGTVHAIASCNAAELAGGSCLDASLPPTHRWIPKGMDVRYLATAKSDIRAVATVENLSGLAADEARDVVVGVDVTDDAGVVVVHADITMWVSPRPSPRTRRG